MAELERETVSAAGLTLKRNTCRSKQNTWVEAVQISHWWPVQWSVVDLSKRRFRGAGRLGEGRVLGCFLVSWFFVSLNFGGLVVVGSQLTCAHNSHLTCARLTNGQLY